MPSSSSSRLPAAILVLLYSAACSSSPTTASSAATFTPSIAFTGGDVFTVGQVGQLSAIERQSASASQDVTKTAVWQSSNPSVAIVSATGLVTAMALGATIITASDQTAAGTLVVSVVPRTVSSLLVVGPAVIPTGQTSELTASATTTSGKQVVTSGVSWQSSDPGVATVSDAGILTAIAPGTVTVTATYQGVTGSLAVTIADVAVTAITFYGTTTVTRGGTTQLTAAAVLGDGSMRIVTNFAAWASLNTDVATVSSGGLVTTLSTVSTAGTVTITATYQGTTGSVDITVN
jgi:uncharacterized protein YjdB